MMYWIALAVRVAGFVVIFLSSFGSLAKSDSGIHWQITGITLVLLGIVLVLPSGPTRDN